MLALCEQHSAQLGYKWSPSKCAVLNHPSTTSSTSSGFSFSLYGESLPAVPSFKYLGVPFSKKGLDITALIELRTPGTHKAMALLNRCGVNRAGFSLLLCSRLYSTFIRPKFEYGLAISHLKAPDFKALERLQDSCLRLLVGGHSNSSTTVLKHITALPDMRFRVDTLISRFALRLSWLPQDALLTLLSSSYPTQLSRINFLRNNPLFVAMPSPPPSEAQMKKYYRDQHQIAFDAFLQRSPPHKLILLRRCRPLLGFDPILYVPATREERSLLVRWRLGWLPGSPDDCPCDEDRTSQRHFHVCRAIPPDLWDDLPPTGPGQLKIDYCLNLLPLSPGSTPCPPWWPSLLSLLWHIQTLCRPNKHFPDLVNPGQLWLSRVPSSNSRENLS